MPIMGGCPYCNNSMAWVEPPPNAPMWCKEICEECGKTVWRWLTRINPQAWTEEGFLAQYEVDEEKKCIYTRAGKSDTVMIEYNLVAPDFAAIIDVPFVELKHHPVREA